MICKDCGSRKFRISRVRIEDVLYLALLRYPVRCRECGYRTYSGLAEATGIHKADQIRHRARRQLHTQGKPGGRTLDSSR